MQRLGAAWIATGHYARIRRSGSHVELLKAADAAKDQSYFLHAVPAGALAQTLFPLGGMRKTEVRQIAHAAGLPVFDKRDSTGICFIGERPFQEFLSRHLRHHARTDRDRGGPGYRRTPRALPCIPWVSAPVSRSADAPALPPRPGMWPTRSSGATRSSWSRINTIRCCCRMGSSVEQMQWIDPVDAPAGQIECAVKTRYRQSDLGLFIALGKRRGMARDARSTGARRHARPIRRFLPGRAVSWRRHHRAAIQFRARACRPRARIPYNSLFSVEGS